MTLYVIVTPGHDDRLEKNLGREFPGDYLELEPGQWLVSATGMTSLAISDRLRIGTGENEVEEEDEVEGVVFATSGYGGIHTSDVWEWIASKTKTS